MVASIIFSSSVLSTKSPPETAVTEDRLPWALLIKKENASKLAHNRRAAFCPFQNSRVSSLDALTFKNHVFSAVASECSLGIKNIYIFTGNSDHFLDLQGMPRDAAFP